MPGSPAAPPPTILVSSLRPVAMRLPHDGVEGGMPTPRMLKPPSSTMTTAMPRRAIENMAGNTFGNTSRRMMRPFFAPMLRAASTNSRCAHVSVDGPGDAADDRDRHEPDRDDQPELAFADGDGRIAGEHRDEREREHQLRDGEEDVEDVDQDGVELAAVVAGDQAEERRRRSSRTTPRRLRRRATPVRPR